MNLPHDQDFGRAERFVELWAKAFEKVCSSTAGMATALSAMQDNVSDDNNHMQKHTVMATSTCRQTATLPALPKSEALCSSVHRHCIPTESSLSPLGLFYCRWQST